MQIDNSISKTPTKINVGVFKFLLKLCTKEEFKSKIFSFVSEIDLDEFVSEFWEKHESKIKSFWKIK